MCARGCTIFCSAHLLDAVGEAAHAIFELARQLTLFLCLDAAPNYSTQRGIEHTICGDFSYEVAMPGCKRSEESEKCGIRSDWW